MEKQMLTVKLLMTTVWQNEGGGSSNEKTIQPVNSLFSFWCAQQELQLDNEDHTLMLSLDHCRCVWLIWFETQQALQALSKVGDYSALTTWTQAETEGWWDEILEWSQAQAIPHAGQTGWTRKVSLSIVKDPFMTALKCNLLWRYWSSFNTPAEETWRTINSPHFCSLQ